MTDEIAVIEIVIAIVKIKGVEVDLAIDQVTKNINEVEPEAGTEVSILERNM